MGEAGSWVNDRVVILLPPHTLEVTGAARERPQTTIWELLLPEEAKRLPAELARIDAYLDDERFIAPWRVLSSGDHGHALQVVGEDPQSDPGAGTAQPA